MRTHVRWLLFAVAGLAVIAAALGLAFALLVPSNEEIAARIMQQAEDKLGVKVTLGEVSWQLLPPALVIDGAATVQPQPIRIRRLVAQPSLGAALRRQLHFDHVLIDGAVMPQLSLRGLKVVPAPSGVATSAADNALPLDQLRFRNLTWITRHGKQLEFDGNVLFDPGWRPRQAEVVRPGVKPLTRLTLTRDGTDDRWQLALALGGGTANGEVTVSQGKDGGLQLKGRLEPRDVEVASALAAFKRHSAVNGKASGQTVLSASGQAVGELARSLHTRTNFTVAGATLLQFDVEKAIRSFGQDRAGQTTLKSLEGQMDTQNTPDGMVVRYSALQARGESFSATGQGTIANRQIEGELTVDLAGGLVAVPLKVAGPLDAPQVTVPRSVVAGAAIGTAVLPGVGTVIGARVGAAVGKIFGDGASKPAPPAR